jgi:hypothetical protein
VPGQGALVAVVRHAMTVQFFVAGYQPALKKLENAEVHHNTPPFVKNAKQVTHFACQFAEM